MSSSANFVIGTKRRHLQFDNDVQKAISEFRNNKRRKIGVATVVLSPPSSSVGSSSANDDPAASDASSSKCPPLSPTLSQNAQQQQSSENSTTTTTTTTKEQQNVKLEKIGSYQLLASLEENAAAAAQGVFTAVDTRNDEGRLVICRRLDRSKYAHLTRLSHRLISHGPKTVSVEEDDENKHAYEQIFPATCEIVAGDDGCYYYFEPRHFGSLHAHVVERKRLNEQECLSYFRQIVRLLVYCHRRGVVLRDLKLRKFVFADPERSTIRLDGIDELFICEGKKDGEEEADDHISDRHGCPAYVGPEILDLKQKSYSGRAADMWSLGVLLYVTLYGRYPFYDTTPARLFAKIRQANFHLADEPNVSFDARTLIRYLLRRDPSERPSAMDILAHPWLQSKDRSRCSSARRVCGFSGNPAVAAGIRYIFGGGTSGRNVGNDQSVPCVDNTMEQQQQQQQQRQNDVSRNKPNNNVVHRMLGNEGPAVPEL